VCGVICALSGQTKRLFPADEFWKGAFFGTLIGGIITVVLLKLWEKKGTALERLELGKNLKSGLQNMMSGFDCYSKWVRLKLI